MIECRWSLRGTVALGLRLPANLHVGQVVACSVLLSGQEMGWEQGAGSLSAPTPRRPARPCPGLPQWMARASPRPRGPPSTPDSKGPLTWCPAHTLWSPSSHPFCASRPFPSPSLSTRAGPVTPTGAHTSVPVHGKCFRLGIPRPPSPPFPRDPAPAAQVTFSQAARPPCSGGTSRPCAPQPRPHAHQKRFPEER